MRPLPAIQFLTARPRRPVIGSTSTRSLTRLFLSARLDIRDRTVRLRTAWLGPIGCCADWLSLLRLAEVAALLGIVREQSGGRPRRHRSAHDAYSRSIGFFRPILYTKTPSPCDARLCNLPSNRADRIGRTDPTDPSDASLDPRPITLSSHHPPPSPGTRCQESVCRT